MRLDKELIKISKIEKLRHQLFIGKVSVLIGFEKTLELLKECSIEIDKIKTYEDD